jgi:putative tryptophan/tyrosine transport system substrate-binding protein
VPAAASGFRTIQDCPKDLEALPVQPNLAVRGTAGSGGEPMLDLRRRQFITLMGGAPAAWPLAARAQRAKTNRIGWLDAGCLVSYGPNRKFEAKRIAGYVEKIIAGEKPEDLPIETPTKFELVINLNTAKALGLEIPPTVLARADEVIE